MRNSGILKDGIDCEKALAALVVRARRRELLAGLLVSSLMAALLNEGVRWGSIGVKLWSGNRSLPVVDVGPFFLLALTPFLLRRSRLPAVAQRVDSRLGLRERLTSYLDFRERADVSADLRGAQARETVRALAGAGAVVPLRPWLAAGPVLLVASLMYPLMVPTMEQTPTVRLLRRTAPGGAPLRAGAGGEHAAPHSPPGGRPKGPDGGRERGTKPGEQPVDQRTADAGKLESASGEQDRAEELQAEKGRSGEDARPKRGRPSQGEPPGKEPERIESERVGTRLAKVVDPLFSPGASSPSAVVPAGSLAFHLLPKPARSGSAAEGNGIEVSPERVTIDFDALPEQYRPLVKTYFELLASVSGAENSGQPAPGKE